MPHRSSAATVWKRYAAYLREPPQLTVRWRDRGTGARGWLVVNSLRGGAAGGGTRMRPGVDLREVTYLAKAMELKFALSGPPIGGAKAGLDFDPTDPRKPDVLARWYRSIAPFLRDCYGTGGDLNVDEVTDVIPAFRALGFSHPQEGIVRGHLRPDPERLGRILHLLEFGVKASVNGRLGVEGQPLTVSDLITGYGVARAVEGFFARRGASLDGRRVSLEGFGNVGAPCGMYLARAGARVVAIADARSVLLEPEGLDAEAMESLLRASRAKLLPDDPRCVEGEARDAFWDARADVFVAAALSGTLDPSRLGRLERAGVRVLACGANNPFRERATGTTSVQREADRRFAILPDILSNCGMARTFAWLMCEAGDAEPDGIFASVDGTIGATLDEVLERAGSFEAGLLAATLALTLDRIGA